MNTTALALVDDDLIPQRPPASPRPSATAPLVPSPARAGGVGEGPATHLPAAQRRLRVGMPQLDAGGLSENWLFRYAGDLHWEAIANQLQAKTDRICASDGDRLYPTVVAARARYESALSAAHENDVLTATVDVSACGRSCAHGRILAEVASPEFPASVRRFSLELLTTFAVRDSSGALRRGAPAARQAAHWTPAAESPPLARVARAARRGEPLAGDNFSGPGLLAPARPIIGGIEYEPSPYADYNGAGLLYFASYATIADTVERRLVRALHLAPPSVTTDWALATSAMRRDVFYYANLPLGESLRADLLAFDYDRRGVGTTHVSQSAGSRHPSTVKTRVRLLRAQTGQPIADVITLRRFVAPVRGGGTADRRYDP